MLMRCLRARRAVAWAVAQHYAYVQTSRGPHVPEGKGHFYRMFKYKFAEVRMSRRAKELAYLIKKEIDLYSATVTTSGPSIAAVRPATLGLTTVAWA